MDAVEPSLGYTPLHMAVLRKNITVAKALLDLGADMHHKTYNNISPYMLSQAVSSEGDENGQRVAALFQERVAASTQVSPEAQLGSSLQHILKSLTGNLVEGAFQGVRRNLPVFYTAMHQASSGAVDGASSAAVQHAPQLMGLAHNLGNSFSSGAFSSLEEHRYQLRDAGKNFGSGLQDGIGKTQFNLNHRHKHSFCTIQ